MGLSLGIHVAVVVGILLFSLFGPAPTPFELPPGSGSIDVFTPKGDSAVFKVGPLARSGGQKATVAEKSTPPAARPEPAKEPEPAAKASPPPAPEPSPPPKAEPAPEPAPVKPPEPKPLAKDALPDPLVEQKKLEEKKAEEKKLAEKKAAEQKKLADDKKKAEEKKLADEKKKADEKKLADEKKKAEEKKLAEEKKKAEEKRLADEKKAAEDKKLADEKKAFAEKLAEVKRLADEKRKKDAELAATTTPGDEGGTSSRPTPVGSGGGTATEAGSTGDPNGGSGNGRNSPEFYAYIGHLYQSVKKQWVWADDDPSLVAAIQFSILPDGSIADARITKRSRVSQYDDSALKAVRAAALSPPPASVAKFFADVELKFEGGQIGQ